MTIEEYFMHRAALRTLSAAEKEFLRDICRASDHEWFKDPNEFADVCVRCETKESWTGTKSEYNAKILRESTT